MTRAVVNVATTEYYRRGQQRLGQALLEHGCLDAMFPWINIQAGWPSHEQKPYGFKAYAMKQAARANDLLLWCDSSILPIRSMEPLWERIEREGYWFSKGGWNNAEWTADSAYPDLFLPERMGPYMPNIDDLRRINRTIPHVVATAFGINVKHPRGRAFLDEYLRLASETNAFCGPWVNSFSTPANPAPRTAICGPQDVRGHRHDQTAASVIAWRLGMELTTPPIPFSYGKAGDTFDEGTILIADGSYA